MHSHLQQVETRLTAVVVVELVMCVNVTQLGVTKTKTPENGENQNDTFSFSVPLASFAEWFPASDHNKSEPTGGRRKK